MSIRERALGPPAPHWRRGDVHLRALFRGHGYLMNSGFDHLFDMDEGAYEAFVVALEYFALTQVTSWLEDACEALEADAPRTRCDSKYSRFGDGGLDAAVVESSALKQEAEFAPLLES